MTFLEVKIIGREQICLPQTIFSPNAADKNCEIALFKIVQRSDKADSGVYTILQGPGTRGVSYASGGGVFV